VVAYDIRLEWLQKHVQEMLAVEMHILGMLRRSKDQEIVAAPEAATTLLAAERALAQHVAVLENYLEGIGGQVGGGVKRAVAHVAETLGGMYARWREHQVSRFLRDLYASLGLAAISYEMLHTTALAHRERHLAQVAMAHLGDLTPLIVAISKLVPHVVAHEATTHEGATVDVGEEAEANTHRAWTGWRRS
jgi:hypothetical protein